MSKKNGKIKRIIFFGGPENYVKFLRQLFELLNVTGVDVKNFTMTESEHQIEKLELCKDDVVVLPFVSSNEGKDRAFLMYLLKKMDVRVMGV